MRLRPDSVPNRLTAAASAHRSAAQNGQYCAAHVEHLRFPAGGERRLAGDGLEPGRRSGADRVERGRGHAGDLPLDLRRGALARGRRGGRARPGTGRA